jgi:hypothetical protein
VCLEIQKKVKVKVKSSLCLTKHHALKTYWGNRCIVLRILDLGTRWRSVVSFTPRPLYPREGAHGTHWIGGWVGPTAILNAVVKRKIPKTQSTIFGLRDGNRSQKQEC